MSTVATRANGAAAKIPGHKAPAVYKSAPSTPGPLLRANFEFLRIIDVRESGLNPRKTFNQASLEELAQSIRESGVWTPITVRPLDKPYSVTTAEFLPDSPVRYVAVKNIVGGQNIVETFSGGSVVENEAAALNEAARRNSKEPCYEIAAGHRRYRAAKMAGLTQIPAIVRAMSDQQFAELITFENLGREDVHPIEEAGGFQLLITGYGYTPAQIAEKIGCSEGYVHKRLRLARLIEPARKAFAEGDISLNHAILIARLEPEQQKQAFGMCIQEHWDHVLGKHTKAAIPAAALDARIRTQILLDLSAAPWKKDDAELVRKAGSCTTCPKRTGSNAELFDDFKKGDHCLDRECFEKKRNAFVDVKTFDLAKKNGVSPVRVATSYADEKTLKQLNAVREYSFRKLTKKDRCGSAETALVVYGDDIGHTFEICRDGKCKKHHPYGNGHNDSQSPQRIAAERKRKTEEKIDAEYRRSLWLRMWDAIADQGVDALSGPNVDLVTKYLIDHIGHDGRGPLIKVLGLELGKKASTVYVDNAKVLNAYYRQLSEERQMAFVVALAVAPALGSMFGDALKSLESLARDAGVDTKAVRKEIAAPILASAKKRAENEKKKAAEAKKGAPKTKAAKAAAATDQAEIEDAGLDAEDEGEDDYELNSGEIDAGEGGVV